MKKFLLVLLVFGTAGIVNAAVTDDFESYAPGTLVTDLPNWYTSSGSSRSVETGIGVGGSQGVDASGTIATWSKGPMEAANHVAWLGLSVGDYVTLSADFQAHDDGAGGGKFDDDRLGMMSDYNSTTSDRIIGAQLEGHHIETYWDRLGSSSGPRITLDGSFTLVNQAWYHFEVTITKAGAEDVIVAASLTDVGSGILIGSGSQSSIGLGADRPNTRYFSDNDSGGYGLWPAFKNHSGGANFDNMSYSGVIPEPMTLSLLGLGGLALIRRRRA